MAGRNCLGFATFSASTGSTGVANIDGSTGVLVTSPYGASGAILSVETAEIRFRIDGTDPTTAIGHPLAAGSILTFDSWTSPGNNWKQALKKFRVIGVTTNVVHVSFID